MKRLKLSSAAVAAVLSAGVAHAECGDVTMVAFSWQSAEVMPMLISSS